MSRILITILLLTITFSQSISSFTKSMSKAEGYFDFYHDAEKDKIYLVVDNVDKEFLYVNSLPAGLGSNDIGLDRGQLGGESVVAFRKYGQKLFLQKINLAYRAVSNNQEEVKSVSEAFANSFVASFKIEASTGSSYLIDLTDFIIRDSHGVSSRLKDMNQGNFSLDPDKSALYLDRTKAFPKNTEFEAIITFKGEAKGSYLRSVTPDNHFFTLRVHHSFIELPDDGYKKRIFDPRAPFFGISYQDYATPIDQPLVKRFISRHRLEKKNPDAEVSEAVEPIIYYLDPGAPEPIRSALIDGAMWWNQAFEAIGYKDAFQVKILPKDADPMDVRYNLIQWVHRSTRGWSYGSSVSDPRTGEIIKGHVSLGSLRVRQDFMIAQGLLSPFKQDIPEENKELLELSLARLRQLSAHEVGHTIGIAHNFAASYNERASVMDYPHPYILQKGSGLDFSQAYDDKIGEWDKISIAYGYGDYENDDDLKAVLDKATRDGFKFITDRDARPISGLHPTAHLWDNGKNAAEELDRVMKIREIALKNISKNTIKKDQPMSEIETVLVPIYFFHRYQMEGAVKLIGGMDYSYNVKNDGQAGPKPVSGQVQKAALNSILKASNARTLRLPDHILELVPPKAFWYPRDREQFNLRTSFNLDPISLAESATYSVYSMLLNPARLLRVAEFHARDESHPSIEYLMSQIENETIDKQYDDQKYQIVQDAISSSYIKALMNSYADPDLATVVKAEMRKQIDRMMKKLRKRSNEAFAGLILEELTLFMANPKEYNQQRQLSLPPGSPIGSDLECYFLAH